MMYLYLFPGVRSMKVYTSLRALHEDFEKPHAHLCHHLRYTNTPVIIAGYVTDEDIKKHIDAYVKEHVMTQKPYVVWAHVATMGMTLRQIKFTLDYIMEQEHPVQLYLSASDPDNVNSDYNLLT